MEEKKKFEDIREYLESYLTPEHIVNERFSSQNFWMMMEREKYKQKKKERERLGDKGP
jgi:hypothetical protein